MVDLSVVVIIYKIEDYLRQCIDSILKQTYKDFELILVDDGSPDHCPEICDEYASRDSRVRVIHQENQGSVTARWNGVKASFGKYALLLDGDDWLDEDAFLLMMELAEKNDADIVISGYKECRSSGQSLKRNVMDSGVYRGGAMQGVYGSALYTGQFYVPGIIPALWNKLIRRELFFLDFKAPDRMLRMGDDASVSYPMIARAKTVVIDNDIHPYNYRILEGSMSRAYDKLYLERVRRLIDGLKDNLACSPDMLKCVDYYALFLIKIGTERVLAGDVSLSLPERMRIVKEMSFYIMESINEEDINWQDFDRHEKKLFSLLLKGNVTGVMLNYYSRKTAAKMKRVVERYSSAFKEIGSKRR